MTFNPAQLLQQLAQLPPATRYRVAYSGGCDSHVLLHALAGLRPQLGAPLEAIHINHGLSPQAPDWSGHCRKVCAALDIPFTDVVVNAHPRLGEGPEAAARAARYAAWRGLLQAGEGLLLAHHQDDQAETLLLQLLRGSGVKGLAAMPASQPFAVGWLGRPLLGFSRAALRRYAEAQGLHWIEDPSNFAVELDRNYLRHAVMPLLQERWPAMAATLNRASRHQAEAADLLEELAQLDLQHVADPEPGQDCLRLGPLQALSPARQRNLLRYWLTRYRGLSVPDHRHLNRILDEVLYAAPDANPLVHWPGAEVRRYAGRLYAQPPAPPLVSVAPLEWQPLEQPELMLNGLQLQARRVRGQGLRLAAIPTQGLRVGFRRGGERCHLPGRAHHHSLKKLLQAWRVPPWKREHIPLIWLGEELAQVVGYCLCQPYQAAETEEGLVISLREPD